MDGETPMLLPPDLREWVPANHLVHFVINAIGELDVRMATRQRAGQRERAVSAGDDARAAHLQLGDRGIRQPAHRTNDL